MRIFVATFVAVATLSACGGGDSSQDSSVSVYKYSGSLQCQGGGSSLIALQSELVAAKVQVHGGTCGHDGDMYAAACGLGDGRIGIFQIPAAQLPAATAVGFASLSTKPKAIVVPCT